jgi:HTH-type transcriptional regulator / antitoxin HipB
MVPNGNTDLARTELGGSEDVGRAVRAARVARGLRQEDLALVSGTGRRFIGDLERGKPSLQLAPVLSVLHALGLRLEVVGPAGSATAAGADADSSGPEPDGRS